jgi:hypothetical protein
MSAKLNRGVFLKIFVGLVFALCVLPVQAQTEMEQVAKSEEKPKATVSSNEATPVFSEYRGIKIGMLAKEVRSSLDDFLKDKAAKQDFLVLSDSETAQVFYNDEGKVTAISVDYMSKSGKAPTPMEVVGTDISPKPDGSMYFLKRYPAAGYWVSYNRTAGESGIITITMQVLQ